MPDLKLTVLSLRYSSWSMRPWLTLMHAGAAFETETVELPNAVRQGDDDAGGASLAKVSPEAVTERRELGSVTGLFPVLRVDGAPIHESLAICEYVAEAFPEARLWPGDVVERARARAICCEMVSGFANMRAELSSHLFARVPGFRPSAGAQADIDRVFEIWSHCLERSGGPFLFGHFTIADAMYFPVLGRFRTYAVPIPSAVADYTRVIDDAPAVQALREIAREGPKMEVYDDYVRSLGGDSRAELT